MSTTAGQETNKVNIKNKDVALSLRLALNKMFTEIYLLLSKLPDITENTGLDSDNLYDTPVNSNYLKTAKSIHDATLKLDTQLKKITGENLDNIIAIWENVGLDNSTGDYNPPASPSIIHNSKSIMSALDLLSTYAAETRDFANKMKDAVAISPEGDYIPPENTYNLDDSTSVMDALLKLDEKIPTTPTGGGGIIAIKEAAGLNEDGEYEPPTTSTYIREAANIAEATEKLDTQSSKLEKSILQSSFTKELLDKANTLGLETLSDIQSYGGGITVTGVDDVWFKEIKGFSNFLNATGIGVTFCPNVEKIDDLSNNTKLRSININGTELHYICKFNKMTELTDLTITHNHIKEINDLPASLVNFNGSYNSDLTLADQVANLPNLEHFAATNCNDSLETGDFSPLTKLKIIQLDSNNFSTAQVDEFLSQFHTAYTNGSPLTQISLIGNAAPTNGDSNADVVFLRGEGVTVTIGS